MSLPTCTKKLSAKQDLNNRSSFWSSANLTGNQTEPDVFYNIDNDTVDDFLILFKDEKDLLRAFRERLGFKVEHLS